MKKICKFIVDHAKTILILFIPILILCALSIDKVNIDQQVQILKKHLILWMRNL